MTEPREVGGGSIIDPPPAQPAVEQRVLDDQSLSAGSIIDPPGSLHEGGSTIDPPKRASGSILEPLARTREE